MKSTTLTATQTIVLAANDLASNGREAFTEWDLTVAAWRRDPYRFGLRGYEDVHPDHKRVMSEVMGQTKRDNAVRRGWLVKTGTNRYQISVLGRSEAERLGRLASITPVATRSPQNTYDLIEPYVFHRAFLAFCRDQGEPRTWLSASSFLGLSQNTPNALEDRFRAANSAIDEAIAWMDETGQATLNRGPVGGKRTIRRADVDRLRRFLQVLEERFAVQLDAIRRKV